MVTEAYAESLARKMIGSQQTFPDEDGDYPVSCQAETRVYRFKLQGSQTEQSASAHGHRGPPLACGSGGRWHGSLSVRLTCKDPVQGSALPTAFLVGSGSSWLMTARQRAVNAQPRRRSGERVRLLTGLGRGRGVG
jgi:hypothetical protein